MKEGNKYRFRLFGWNPTVTTVLERRKTRQRPLPLHTMEAASRKRPPPRNVLPTDLPRRPHGDSWGSDVYSMERQHSAS